MQSLATSRNGRTLGSGQAVQVAPILPLCGSHRRRLTPLRLAQSVRQAPVDGLKIFRPSRTAACDLPPILETRPRLRKLCPRLNRNTGGTGLNLEKICRTSSSFAEKSESRDNLVVSYALIPMHQISCGVEKPSRSRSDLREMAVIFIEIAGRTRRKNRTLPAEQILASLS